MSVGGVGVWISNKDQVCQSNYDKAPLTVGTATQ